MERRGSGKTRSRKNGRRRQPQKGKRYTPEQKKHALTLVASGMDRVAISELIGATTESIRLWVKAAEANGSMPEVPVMTPTGDVAARKPSDEDPAPERNGGSPTEEEATSDGQGDAGSSRSIYTPMDLRFCGSRVRLGRVE